MPVRVALVQVGITDEEPVAARVDRVLATTAEVATDHDLLVLPELWPIGAFAVDLVAPHAQPADGPLVRALAGVAADAGAWLFGGSFPECVTGPDGVLRHYNTQVVLAPDGSVAATYRKVHLFGFNGGETTVMSSGEALAVIDSPLGRTGLATCYDLRFPELFRQLVDAGAEAFVLPAGWPERRQVHWQVLARARAVEDQAYVLACNEAGTHAGVPMAGLSMVVDPQGEVLAEAGPGEEVLSVEVDPTRVAAWRGAFPALDDRRMG
ncbi:MAG: carbon-nitrogen family hydrolase [Candidatus Nanopelagicales bacterium]|nr:carbon-nitrogen family hydrolase [Candidatus Nanopelagicales bacterium]